MFWNFVLRAVQFRKRRLTLAFAALAVSATLATVRRALLLEPAVTLRGGE